MGFGTGSTGLQDGSKSQGPDKKKSEKKVALRYQLTKNQGAAGKSKTTSMTEKEAGPCMQALRQMLMSQTFEMSVGFIVLANFIVISMETDAYAAQRTNADGSKANEDATTLLELLTLVNYAFMIVYVSECILRMIAEGFLNYFRNAWNSFDFFIVFMGIAAEILTLFAEKDGLVNVQILRTLRMVRVFRISRLVISFHDLYSLVTGLTNSFRTLAWAAALIFLMLTMFSILAVEFLDPLMAELDEASMFEPTCYWCGHAFENIMHANLTFFQIISGDGFSTLTRPIIEKHPWTSLFFGIVIFTMIFGLMNLITAVIVDTAVQAREADVLSEAHRLEEGRKEAWRCFTSLCASLDKDGSGDISIQELEAGVHEHPELQAHLSVLGVEDDDLQMVFEILDPDDDGVLTHKEFATHLYKMKTQSLQTTCSHIKHYVVGMSRNMKSIRQTILPGSRDAGSRITQRGARTTVAHSTSAVKDENTAGTADQDQLMKEGDAFKPGCQQILLPSPEPAIPLTPRRKSRVSFSEPETIGDKTGVSVADQLAERNRMERSSEAERSPPLVRAGQAENGNSNALNSQHLEAIFERAAVSRVGCLTFEEFTKLAREVHQKEQPGKPPLTEEFAKYVFTDPAVLAFPNTEYMVTKSDFVARFNKYWVPRSDLLEHFLHENEAEQDEAHKEFQLSRSMSWATTSMTSGNFGPPKGSSKSKSKVKSERKAEVSDEVPSMEVRRVESLTTCSAQTRYMERMSQDPRMSKIVSPPHSARSSSGDSTESDGDYLSPPPPCGAEPKTNRRPNPYVEDDSHGCDSTYTNVFLNGRQTLKS